MARSTYIYVVMGVAIREPVKAFTVKKEMLHWLGRNPCGNSWGYELWRVRDGLSTAGNSVNITAEVKELWENDERNQAD